MMDDSRVALITGANKGIGVDRSPAGEERHRHSHRSLRRIPALAPTASLTEQGLVQRL